VTEFYIVRHGQSQANLERVVQGPAVDTPLTEKGIRQAEELAEAMKDKHFDAIYSSDTVRASQTAGIIAKRLGLQVHTSHQIRERSFGKYVGMDVDEFLAKYRDFDSMTTQEKLEYQIDENEESNLSGLMRLTGFLQETALDHPGETVLVVTHEGLIRSFLIYNSQGDFDTIGGLDNCGYVRVKADDADYMIDNMNGVLTWDQKHRKK
jgi:2,3-bisphosphoglycerate-dependent phosphoglycerate mutase